MPISSIWKRDFPFLGLWWEPLENNANIFYLKTGFPLFFLACDGNLWKIISISSIWNRNFRVFSGLVMGTSFENWISVSFWAFLENNANIFYLKTEFPFFSGLVMGTSFENGISVSFWAFLENNANIFYLKTGFPFFGLGMGTSGKQCQYLLFKNGISVVLFGLWWEPLENNANIVSFSHGISVSFWAFLENNANIFYLKTGFLFFWACDGNLWKIISISSIW